MGYVVAALKVLHGLDGRTHTDYGDVMAPSGGWVGRRTEARRAGRNAVPTTRRGAHKTKKNFKKEAGAAGDDDDVTDAASNRTSVRIDPPSEGWTAWAEATMRTGASVPRLPVRVAEAATRDPETENSGDGRDLESVDAFLEYCRTHALRGLRGGLPEAHRRTVDALWRVHATGGGSAGAAEEEVQVQVPEPEAPVMIAESGRPPASTRAHTSSSSPPDRAIRGGLLRVQRHPEARPRRRRLGVGSFPGVQSCGVRVRRPRVGERSGASRLRPRDRRRFDGA